MTLHRHQQRSEAAAHRIDGGAFDNSALVVTAADAAVSVLTFVLSTAVFWSAIRGAPIGVVAALQGGVVCVPLAFLGFRNRAGGELVVPLLLLIAVAVSGPVGAAGCTAMTLVLWLRRPEPRRLQRWYDYIAGVGQRTPMEETYTELTSARLSTDFSAPVHRFDPILSGTSLVQQQRVLSVIGRNYHPDFHASLKKALRNRNILIRAQAAAIASLLAPEDKTRLWQPAAVGGEPPDLGQIANVNRVES
jgi:hypothetical protein